MFSGSIVAIITPFVDGGGIDYAALKRLIELHAAAGTSGIVVGGTTGESATLTATEHAELIHRSVEMIDGRMHLIAGTGSNSTAQTVALSKATDVAGVYGFLLVAPYYNKPPQRGMITHFHAVADVVSKPVMLRCWPSIRT